MTNRIIRRRDLLTGTAALAAIGGIAHASGLSGSINPQIGGGIGQGFDGGLGGAGNTPAPPADADFSNPNNSQVIVILAF